MATVLDELITRLIFKADDKALKTTKQQIQGIEKAVKKTGKVLDGFRKGIVGAFAAVGVVRGATSLITAVKNTSKEFQSLRASLKTVTGSNFAAAQSFRMIKTFARETPFTVKKVTEAFIKLKGLGLDPSAEALRSYGNTASSMNKDLMDMIEAVADATTGEFERLKEFGIRASQQGDQVAFTFQGVTTVVAKEATAIEGYLRGLGDNQFAGAMSEQMKTLGGQFSNLEDTADAFLLKIGEGGLADAIAVVTAGMSEMISDGEGLAEVIGEVLGAAVVEAFEAFKDLVGALRRLKSSDVRSFIRGLGQALSTMLQIIVFAVKHWKSFLAIIAGVKLHQGISAAITGLKGLGIAASSSLGPIGAIVSALVALIPVAIEAGNAIGDVISRKGHLARVDSKKSSESMRNILEVGKLGARGRGVAQARAAATARFEAADAQVKRLAAQGDTRSAEFIKAELARDQASARMADLDKKAKKVIRDSEKKKESLEALRAIQGERLRGDMVARENELRADDETALLESIVGGDLTKLTGKRKKAFEKGRGVLRSGGSLDDAKAAASKEQGRGRGRGRAKKKKKKEESAGLKRVNSRIDELVQQAETRAFLRRTDLRTTEERDQAARAAGIQERKRLQSAVDSGRLSALGGDFSGGGATQLLRDAGILDPSQTASPPVLTVTIVKADVKLDAPVSVSVASANASSADIGRAVRAAVKTGIADQVGKAIESAMPKQAR